MVLCIIVTLHGIVDRHDNACSMLVCGRVSLSSCQHVDGLGSLEVFHDYWISECIAFTDPLQASLTRSRHLLLFPTPMIHSYHH
jgi:hypothetical protein